MDTNQGDKIIMANFGDALKEFISFLFKVLRKTVGYLDVVELRLKVAYVFVAPIIDFIRNLVEKEDEYLNGLPPGLTDDEIAAQKQLAFNRVVNTTESSHSASPSFVPRGFIKSLVEDIVFVLHHPAEDERDGKARLHGYLRPADSDDIKKIVEEGLNKGWGHGH